MKELSDKPFFNYTQMKTMKLNKLFFALLLAITTLAVSCSKDEVVKEQSRIDTSDIMLSLEKGTESISFFAADEWTAALSTTSWIKIDPMTKGGQAGESKVTIEWEKNTSVKERVADLTIAVRGESPVKIRLTQFPEKASLTVSKSELNLVVKPNAGNGRGQFVDTISVKSNIKWTLKNIPAWIEYSTVGDKEPQDGIPTDIQLIISADAKKFNQTVMSSILKIGAADASDLDAEIAVSAETVLKSLDKDMNAVTTLPLTYSTSLSKYAASVKMVSNAMWKVKECPQWAQPSYLNNATEYASTLNTEITVWFTIDSKDLDTDKLSGNVVFVNEQTNTTVSFELTFKGTGTDFFEYNLILNPDAPFEAKGMDENWNPIPGATSIDFPMTTGKEYTGIHDAPFKFHFVNSHYGIAQQEPAYWANVEIKQDFRSTKSPLITKELTVFVQDRQEGEENPYEGRYAYMIATPANVEFDDLFDENGKLKAEYENVAKLFGQKGLEEPKFESAIPELIMFTAEGAEKSFEIINGPSMISTDLAYMHPWIELSFKMNEMGRPSGIVIKTKPNTTGKARSQVIKVKEYKPATDSEVDIYEFTVTQTAE